eukprot:5909254-Pyramimonas_sp.AAC.1
MPPPNAACGGSVPHNRPPPKNPDPTIHRGALGRQGRGRQRRPAHTHTRTAERRYSGTDY